MDFRKVKAVLFDLDGTLLDTVRDIGACVNDVMRRYGFPEHTREEYMLLVGHGAKNLITGAVPPGTPEELIEKVWSEYVPYYRENSDRLTVVFPGTKEFLAWLTLKGYRLGMVTNKTQMTAEKVMATYFPETRFEILWGNNGVRPLKPSVESGKLACDTLGVQPEEILFVGDGDTDMEFASSCGFIACGVTWGYRSRETLLRCGAELLVDSYAELRSLMEQ